MTRLRISGGAVSCGTALSSACETKLELGDLRRALLALRDVMAVGLGLGVGHRAQDVAGGVVDPGAFEEVAHGMTSRRPPSCARIFSRPRRMRPLIVPIGVSSIEAISVCVKPPKYASSITRHCSAGSVVSAWRISCASSSRATSTSVRSRASKRSSMPSSLARRRSWTTERRSESIARLWTMPEHPRADRAAGAVVARAAAPQRQERLLDDVLGGRAAAAHAVGERERGAGVPLVDDLEGRRLAAADELHEVLVGEVAQLRRAGLGCFA